VDGEYRSGKSVARAVFNDLSLYEEHLWLSGKGGADVLESVRMLLGKFSSHPVS